MAEQTFVQAFTAQRAARRASRRPRTSLTIRAGRILGRALPTWAGIRRFVLSVSGFGALSFAAWQMSEALGYAAAGLSLLILEALTGSDR